MSAPYIDLGIYSVKETGQTGWGGAVGNGVTDDTIAIQNTITYVETNAPGSVVWFPPGNYIISDTLLVSTSDTTLYGEGLATIQWPLNPILDADMLQINGADRVTIDGLTIEYQGNTTIFSCIQVLGNPDQLVIRNTECNNGRAGIYVSDGCTALSIYDCTINTEAANVYAALYLDSTSSAHDVNEANIVNLRCGNGGAAQNTVGYGVLMGSCQAVHMVNCRFIFYNIGIAMQPGATGNCFNHKFDCCTSDVNGTNSFNVAPTADAQVYNVTFSNCWLGGSSSQGVYIPPVPSGSVVAGLNFSNCGFIHCAGAGIYLSGGSGITVTGGVCHSDGLSNVIINGLVSGVTISGCSLAQSSTYGGPAATIGVTLEGGCSDVRIDSCDLTGTTGWTALKATGSSVGANVVVTNCNGYNVPASTLTNTIPISGNLFSATDGVLTIGGAPIYYYGPVVVYVGASVSTIVVSGNTTGLTSGSIPLAPGENMKTTYTTAPVHFAVIGV